MYHRVQEVWESILDISEVLNRYWKNRKWKDINEFTDITSRKRPHHDETQQNIVARSFSMATTAFVWSEAILDKNSNNCSILITAQKNGTLILWTVKSKSSSIVNSRSIEQDHINVEVSKLFNSHVGMISSLNLFSIDTETSILLVGALDGRLKVKYVVF